MAQGTVRWFNSEKGYGLIAIDGGGPDVFVHFSSIEADDVAELRAGHQVEFEISHGQRGPKAERVRVVATGPPPGPDFPTDP